MEIRYLLSALSVLVFLAYFFYKRFTRRAYLLFVLYFLPFIDLTVTNVQLGSFTVFDLISYFSAIFLINDFVLNSKRTKAYFLLLCSFLLVLLIGSIQSEFITNSFIIVVKFGSIFIYANSVLAEFYEDPAIVSDIIKGLKFSCLASVAFLLIQLFAGLGFSFYPYLNINITDSNVTRYPSFFQDPQMFSQFIAMCSFLFLIKEEHNSRTQYLNYASFILILFAIFFSGGRSGFLGLCLGMVIIFITGKNRFRFFAIGCCLIAFLIATYFPDHFSMFNRQEGYDEAYQVRSQIWNEAYAIFLNNPLLGIGMGNYNKYMELHSLTGYYIIDDEVIYYGTESGYLKILVETGICGFIFFFSFILVPIFIAVKAYLQRINNYNIFYIVAALISWMTAFSTLNTLSDKRTLIMVTSLICLLIISAKKNDNY